MNYFKLKSNFKTKFPETAESFVKKGTPTLNSFFYKHVAVLYFGSENLSPAGSGALMGCSSGWKGENLVTCYNDENV